MAFVSRKIINGLPRHYLEKSVRLPDGRVKKYSLYLKDYDPRRPTDLKPLRDILEKRIAGDLCRAGASQYGHDMIFPVAALERLEASKLWYKAIRRRLSPAQLRDVVDRFTANFTYESNALEGNSLTLKDVTLLFAENRAARGQDLREVYEALNTRKAMRALFANKLRLTEECVLRLHRILMQNTGVRAGYKALPNFLLGRRMETAPPERVQEEMHKLLQWHHQHPRLHPLQRAAVFHARFEQIHPFEDGNGRVGRVLANVILHEHGYPPLIIRKSQRIAYLAALEAFDFGHKDKLLRFFLQRHRQTYEKFFLIYVKYLPRPE